MGGQPGLERALDEMVREVLIELAAGPTRIRKQEAP